MLLICSFILILFIWSIFYVYAVHKYVYIFVYFFSYLIYVIYLSKLPCFINSLAFFLRFFLCFLNMYFSPPLCEGDDDKVNNYEDTLLMIFKVIILLMKLFCNSSHEHFPPLPTFSLFSHRSRSGAAS